MKVLIVSAVEKEKLAIEEGLLAANVLSDICTFDLFAVGVGPISAAVQTMKLLATKQSYVAVICAGIGGFIAEYDGGPHDFSAGQLWLGTRSIAADLGAESAEGILSLENLGFGSNTFFSDSTLLTTLQDALNCCACDILTVSLATGTDSRLQLWNEHYPNARIEAMEGFGVAAAADAFGLPFVELRSVSNVVGIRQRDAWNIDEALRSLTIAFEKIATLDFSRKEG